VSFAIEPFEPGGKWQDAVDAINGYHGCILFVAGGDVRAKSTLPPEH
jgi:hypothetical protein